MGGGKDSSVRLTHIDSALVSAQHRQRFYVTNFGDIEQPEDRGILLRDVLETDWLTDRDKARTVTSSVGRTTTREYFKKSQNTMAFYKLSEPTNTTVDGKARTIKSQYGSNNITKLCGQGGGVGAKTGLYAVPVGGKVKELPVYEVRDGFITIKDKQYPIKLADGYYLIRKLTPLECERLQTLPDGYTSEVSDTQRYRALGNGWTAEVIIHILNHALKDVPRDEELVVLSMYDGIATGRYCLDKMGFTNVKYYAHEIDPYPIKIAMSNYPDIIQCGDAFRVRNDDWKIPA